MVRIRCFSVPRLLALVAAAQALPPPAIRAQVPDPVPVRSPVPDRTPAQDSAGEAVAGSMPEDYLPALRPILEDAARRSPSALQGVLDMAQAEGNRYQRAAARWPAVNLGGNYSANEASTNGGPVNTQTGLFYDLGVNQPIFQWGALRANAEIGRIGEEVAHCQYEEAYRQLALSLRRQYMALVGRASVLRALRFQVARQEKAVAAARQRQVSGAASASEAAREQTYLEESRLSLDRAILDFSYARRLFARTAGAADLTEASIPAQMAHPRFSAALADRLLDGFQGGGVNGLAGTRILDLQLRQADLSYRIAKVQLMPKFSAALDYRVQDQSTVAPATSGSPALVSQYAVRQGIAGVAVNWPIFDGFATRGAEISALASRRSVERQKDAFIGERIDEARNLRAELDLSVRGLSLVEDRRLDGCRELEKAREDHRLGFGSDATVEASQAAVYALETDALNARIDFLNQWTEFVSSIGVDPALRRD